MPVKSHINSNPNLTGRNYGKPGYCKICDLLNTRPDLRRPLNALMANGKFTTELREWMIAKADFRVDRRTYYNHREHMTDPKTRYVSQVEEQQRKGLLPSNVSEDQYLDAILSAAMQRVIDDPEAVTIDQGLKAAAARTQARASRQGVNVTLQFALSQPLAGVPTLLLDDGSIEGEVTEVP